MSYDVTPGASAPLQRQRPSSVTAAGMLLYATAGLIIIQVILSALVVNRTLKATKEAFANIDNGDSITSITRVTTIGSLVLNVIIAAVFVVFAVYNLRGKQGIRIATWVVGGLAVLCYGCGSIGGSLSTRMSAAGDQDPQMKAATQKVADSLPGWAAPVSTTISVLLFLMVATVIILLAVPASNAYFRKPEAPELAYPSYPPVG